MFFSLRPCHVIDDHVLVLSSSSFFVLLSLLVLEIDSLLFRFARFRLPFPIHFRCHILSIFLVNFFCSSHTHFFSPSGPVCKFFESQKIYKFYSSSILFVFDAASPKGNPTVRVKLVDFAHTFPNKPMDETLDTNFLEALHNLVQMWTDIQSFGVEIYENQRYSKVDKAFATKNLGVGDRPPYSNATGKTRLQFTNPSDWIVDRNGCADPEGWWYANSWSAKTWGERTPKTHVRRRRWVKKPATPRPGGSK